MYVSLGGAINRDVIHASYNVITLWYGPQKKHIGMYYYILQVWLSYLLYLQS